jgi:hypothetical protein
VSVSTVGNISRGWPAWVGDVERLRRLASVVAELIEEPAEAAKSRLRERFKSADVVEQRASDFAPEMVVGEKELGVTHTGHPDVVLDRIDPVVVTRVSISARDPAGDTYRIQLDFSSQGCTLQVSGEPGWVRKAAGTLGGEIGRSVPRWSWLRAGWGVLFYGTIGALALSIIYLTYGEFTNRRGEPDSALAIAAQVLLLGGLFGGFFGGLALSGIGRKLLPAFELLPPNQSSGKGARAIAFIGAQFVALALAFLLSRL